ncbi:MAG: type II secretion system F family protein [Thermodesulfobacteriota bacterium]
MNPSRLKGLELIIPYWYARAEKGLPLIPGPGPDRTADRFLGRYPLYRKIKLGLANGQTLSEALAGIKGVPGYFVQLIREGEAAGRLPQALRMIMDQYPLRGRFHGQVRIIYGYLAAVLIFLAAFLIYYSFIFSEVCRNLAGPGSSIAPPLIMRLLFLGAEPWFLVLLAIGLAISLLALSFILGPNPADRLLLLTPIIGRNYRHILSLEMGVLCGRQLELGRTVPQALAAAGEALPPGSNHTAWRHLVERVEKGEPLSQAFEPELSGWTILETLRLGAASGQLAELLAGANDLLRAHLSVNLDRELERLFKGCILVCGAVAALGIIYVFEAILFSYNLAAMF